MSSPFTEAEVAEIRAQFPVLTRKVHGDQSLVYLDNAATCQKPRSVIDTEASYYQQMNANVHRGMHALAEEATEAYEGARSTLAGFLGVADPRGVIFTRGTTEAINLVAQTWGATQLHAGDEILITVLEHHSNIVPWQLVAQQRGATVKAVPLTPEGEVDLEAYASMLSEKTRMVAFSHISNALGTVNPAKDMIRMAKDAGAAVLVDGAQSAPHTPIAFDELGCDFFACSAHKMCGPTGIGALVSTAEMLDSLPPYQGGGEMIDRVTIAASTWADLPYKFEAGTPNIVGAVAWGEALRYLEGSGLDRIEATLKVLTDDAAARLDAEEGITLTAHPRERGAAVSFWVDGIHPHDVAQLVDQSGVAIRAGHVCCQPLMDHFGQPAINRASYAFYNTIDETTRLLEALRATRKIFGVS